MQAKMVSEAEVALLLGEDVQTEAFVLAQLSW